jgi:hypothetical protein
MAFVRQANPFAHSDVGSVLLVLGKTIPGAYAYSPSYASHAYVVLHTDQNQIFAIAFGQRGLAFRLAEAAHAAALADGGTRAPEVGQAWIRFDLWELNASAGARERLRHWCVRALSDAVLGAS